MDISSDGTHVSVCPLHVLVTVLPKLRITCLSSSQMPPSATSYIGDFLCDPFFLFPLTHLVPHLPPLAIYGSISNPCDKMTSLSYCLLNLVSKCPWTVVYLWAEFFSSLQGVLFSCHPVSFFTDLAACLFFFPPKVSSLVSLWVQGFQRRSLKVIDPGKRQQYS